MVNIKTCFKKFDFLALLVQRTMWSIVNTVHPSLSCIKCKHLFCEAIWSNESKLCRIFCLVALEKNLQFLVQI